MIDQLPGRTAYLLEALRTFSKGDIRLTDTIRGQALSKVPDSPRETDGVPFIWVSDAGIWLEPIYELIVAGRYRWCPFCELSSLCSHNPQGLLDLIWAKADRKLRDGTVLQVYIPVHYPGSENGADAIRLACEIVRQEHGVTCIVGLSQKTWATDTGDRSLPDLREVSFSV